MTTLYDKASLYSAGESHAATLLGQGKCDMGDGWSISAEDENRMLGDPPDWSGYAKMHLGIDPSQPEKTKGRYKYPFGKDDKVYRAALIAIRQRAGQQGDTSVGDAAKKLVDKCDRMQQDSHRETMNVKRFEVIAKTGDKSADIYLYNSIGEEFFGGVSAGRFTKELNALGKVKELNVYIDSDGGDVFDGATIYTNLVRHPATVNTYIDGLAASIASLIAMAGNRITISDVGMLMIHEPWGGVIGNASDMRKRADTLDKVRATLIDVYSRQTKLPTSKISELLALESWFNAAESLEMGFVTDIASPKLMAASAAGCFDLKRFKNAPTWYGRPPVEQPRLVALRAKRGRLFPMFEAESLRAEGSDV